jgi:hypothetical protein
MKTPRFVIGGGALAAATLSASLLLVVGAGSPAASQAKTADSGFPTTQAQANADIGSIWSQSTAAAEPNEPELLLPAAQRTLWIADWNQMATCMQKNGETWFPDAPSTFGNGSTPSPEVGGAPGTAEDVTSAAFQSAQAACPFNTSNLDLSVFQAAEQAWESAHPATGTSSSAPAG